MPQSDTLDPRIVGHASPRPAKLAARRKRKSPIFRVQPSHVHRHREGRPPC